MLDGRPSLEACSAEAGGARGAEGAEVEREEWWSGGGKGEGEWEGVAKGG